MTKMSYEEQLKDDRWFVRRAEILERDDYCCQDCLRGKNKLSSHLKFQVHHKEYINGLMAWEYPDELLITLCRECHAKLHGVIEDLRPERLKPTFVYGQRSLDSQPMRHIRDVMIDFIKSLAENHHG
jgi:5-methylcytosine-specific restriction endonuclease McrA